MKYLRRAAFMMAVTVGTIFGPAAILSYSFAEDLPWVAPLACLPLLCGLAAVLWDIDEQGSSPQ